MGGQLARRGPDDEQIYDDGTLSFVFRRLSIVDVKGGRQPLWNEDNTVCVIVNGEIYNHSELRGALKKQHTFRTRSDSEIVVHLYEELGNELVNHLNGMFAIMVWDTVKQCLFLARDRLGIKPLYYVNVGDSLLFASELKAMLVHPLCPKEFDWSGFAAKIYQTRSVPTYIKGIKCLLGGQFILHEKKRDISPKSYWVLEENFAKGDLGVRKTDYYITRYGELLADSVQKRLMSDVPVGLFLSGGADSVLLAAMAAKYLPDLHCFTVIEKNTVRVGDAEEAYKTADFLKLPFYPVRYDTSTLLDELQYSLGHFEYLVWVMETPRFDIEWLFKHELHRYAKTAVPQLKVILLGQGADEFAGGYSKSLDRNFKSWQQFTATMQSFTRNSQRDEMGIPRHLLPLLSEEYPHEGEVQAVDEYQGIMLQYVYSLQRYNLWHEDRTSSAQGVESRVPFLDHRLVEMLASIPPEFHAALFFNKRILREQFPDWLPSYPKEKAKVKFCRAEHDSKVASMQDFFIGMLQRIFGEFTAKYLGSKKAIFSRSKLQNIYNYGISGNWDSFQALEILLECMAITVFEDMCRNLILLGPPAGIDPPSPLHLAPLEACLQHKEK